MTVLIMTVRRKKNIVEERKRERKKERIKRMDEQMKEKIRRLCDDGDDANDSSV